MTMVNLTSWWIQNNIPSSVKKKTPSINSFCNIFQYSPWCRWDDVNLEAKNCFLFLYFCRYWLLFLFFARPSDAVGSLIIKEPWVVFIAEIVPILSCDFYFSLMSLFLIYMHLQWLQNDWCIFGFLTFIIEGDDIIVGLIYKKLIFFPRNGLVNLTWLEVVHNVNFVIIADGIECS